VPILEITITANSEQCTMRRPAQTQKVLSISQTSDVRHVMVTVPHRSGADYWGIGGEDLGNA
jgi:hypothetical protein